MSVRTQIEVMRNELQIIKSKLDSKCQALVILSRELEHCRDERDRAHAAAAQLRERLRRVGGAAADVNSSSYTGQTSNSEFITFNFEVDDLRARLSEAQSDTKLLREQLARQRVGAREEGGMAERVFPAAEREQLIRELESARAQCVQMERDLKQVLEEKEEWVNERHVYKGKYEHLNQELNFILKGDSTKVVDLDALLTENKYLSERLDQLEKEKHQAIATVSKYKMLLERRPSFTKPVATALSQSILTSPVHGSKGASNGGAYLLNHRHVCELLEASPTHSATTQFVMDLQALSRALLESLNDKTLALSHQRKTNKILGARVSELEHKMRTLEVSGFWSTDMVSSLERLRSECDEVKQLLPTDDAKKMLLEEMSHQDTEADVVDDDDDNDDDDDEELCNNFDAEDLDLLPCKELCDISPLNLNATSDDGSDCVARLPKKQCEPALICVTSSDDQSIHSMDTRSALPLPAVLNMSDVLCQ